MAAKRKMIRPLLETKLRLLIAVLLGVISLAGCRGEPLAEVKGTVRLDGQLLAEGEIIFEADEQDATPEATMIVNGEYQLQLPPGKKIVRINASRPTKIPDPVMGAAARESMILPEFNTESTLRVELKAGKQTGVDFEVQGVP
jgi:hypothetical protein